MTAKDLLNYQFGCAEAIRRVAGSKHLLLVGAALVIITSIPRNYDQTYIGETPWWPVIPLMFSFVSGSFLFFILKGGFIREAEASFARKYWMFLGLFWMTAPVAWLYGIPVERFMDARGAMVANLWLLGVVSVWRVVLLSRVMMVIYRVEFARALGWVLLGASVEVVFVLFFRVLGEGIMRGMGGMRNSPEQDLLIGALNTVFMTCLIAAPILLIAMVALKFPEKARLAELPKSLKVPWIVLTLAAAGWLAAAVVPQQELATEFRYRSYLEEGKFREALAYLNTLEPRDWPPAKSFRPDPYEGEVWNWLPGLLAEVTGREKRWVQRKLLWVFEETFGHRRNRFSEEQYLEMLRGTERLERGKEWIGTSEELWKKPMVSWWMRGWTNLASYLEGHGVKIETKESAK
ncbi:MAG: hypothetical protein ACXW32_07420 [Limisphaerales bacterium]